MHYKSLIFSMTVVCLGLLPDENIFSQESTVHQIVESLHSRLIDRDSTLSDYTILMDITMLNYKKEPPEVEFTEQQQQIYRNGKLVEIQGSADTTSVSSESTDPDTAGNQQGMRMSMTDPLSVFQSPENYTFSLKNNSEDSLLIIQVESKNPTRETYKGTFTLRKIDWYLLRAELTPGAEIPRVRSMETSVIFTEFEGFPVSRSIESRFQGKYLLVFSFNMGFQIEMKYRNIN